MTRFLRTRGARAAAAVTVVGLAALAGAGFAAADAGSSLNRGEAPYAQLAVDSGADGRIVRQRHVERVVRKGVGEYCVKATREANLDIRGTIPIVNRYWATGHARVNTLPSPLCGNATDTFHVTTYDRNWNRVDGRFRLLVP
ncbi:hypothetical protein LG634_26940 [Streptomyces bambusae]|uniref:hypothetical protein n=1 Tax=Streptomyces bambusae TaxID=1550616 RepID=UPI001CFE0AE5|nr:hypothetical protein [Streptomyces bambusae]MCB5168446.1 hypothetical protein [Streptomyces bambusae]